jgi:hypothetical protein
MLDECRDVGLAELLRKLVPAGTTLLALTPSLDINIADASCIVPLVRGGASCVSSHILRDFRSVVAL